MQNFMIRLAAMGLCIFSLPAPALTQEPQQQPLIGDSSTIAPESLATKGTQSTVKPESAERAMAEDMQVMGKLLADTIAPLYESGDGCLQCHSARQFSASWLLNPWHGDSSTALLRHSWSAHAQDWTKALLARPVKDGDLTDLRALLLDEPGTPAAVTPLATYLESYGVVYQLAAPVPAATPENAAPQQANCPFLTHTPWQRAQLQLRGQWRHTDCRRCHQAPKQQKPAASNYLQRWIDRKLAQQWPSAPTRQRLIQAVLDLLAENGHNFRELAPHERVTVSISFRNSRRHDVARALLENRSKTAPQPDHAASEKARGGDTNQPHDEPADGARSAKSAPMPDLAAGDTDHDGLLDLFINNANANRSLFRKRGDGTFEAVGGLGKGMIDFDNDGDLDLFVADGEFDTNRAEASTHELAGDLHMRQHNFRKAVDAYEKALLHAVTKIDPDHATMTAAAVKSLLVGDGDWTVLAGDAAKHRVLYNKLIQALVGADSLDKAQQLIEWIRHGEAKAAQKPSSQAAARQLPARLVVSATKAQLDAVAGGKISKEQFGKQATVHYVDPNAAPPTD